MSILDELSLPLPVHGFVDQKRMALERIIEDPDQPRKEFDATALAELADSIRERGVLLPILIQPPDASGLCRIIDGARRYRASRLAGVADIPVTMREERSGYDQMIANIQRDDLRPSEIAAWIGERLAAGDRQGDIARILGKSAGWVSTHSRYAAFPDFLKAIADETGIHTATELFKAYGEDPERTRWFVDTHEGISREQAIAFRKSLAAPRETAPAFEVDEADQMIPFSEAVGSAEEAAGDEWLADDAAVSSPEPSARETVPPAPSGPAEPSPAIRRASRPKPLLVVVEDLAGRRGQLTGPAAAGACSVLFEDEEDDRTIPLKELRLVDVSLD